MGVGTVIPAGQQAIDFIMTLDERRFAQFKTDIHNCAAAGLAWPGTLQDAYTRVSLYKQVGMKPAGGGTEAVFATEGAKGRKVKPKPKPAGGKSSSKQSKP